MKTCFSTVGCPSWSFSKIVSVAKNLRFDGIEIRSIEDQPFAPEAAAFSKTQLKQTKRSLSDSGLSIPCLASTCNLNFEAQIDKAKQYIDTASALGTPYVRLLGDSAAAPSNGVNLKAVVSHLQEIADYAKQSGVMPLIETNGFFAKTKVLGAMLHRIGRDNIGILYDVHHPYRFFGEHPAYTMRHIGPYIRHVHLKDSLMDGKNVHYKLIGEGDIPLLNAVRTLLSSGYDGYFSFEGHKIPDEKLQEPSELFAHYKDFIARANKA